MKEGRDAVRLGFPAKVAEIIGDFERLRGKYGLPAVLQTYLAPQKNRSVRSTVVEILQVSQPLDDDTLMRYMRRYPVDRLASLYAKFAWQDLELPPESFAGVYEPRPKPGARAWRGPENADAADLQLTICARFACLPWHKLQRPDPGFSGLYIPQPRHETSSHSDNSE